MIIECVNNIDDALRCNELLEKLIRSESKYNYNIRQNYKVKNWFENFYNEKSNAIFVAKENEVIIGYVYIQIISTESGPMVDKEALIDGLYINSEYRGKGIAKKLMNTAEEWAKTNGVKFLYVNVLEENSVANELYKKLNFDNFELKLRKEL